jgi:uncharacterized OB-fold protein
LIAVELRLPPADIVVLQPDRSTAPFWEAAAEHRLVCPRCTSCATYRFPPGPFCPRCRDQEVAWVEVDPHGDLYTYTVVHHAVLPVLRDHVPYAVGLASLPGAGGVRLHGNLIDVDADDLRVGMPVQVVWADLGPGVTVPRLRPSG